MKLIRLLGLLGLLLAGTSAWAQTAGLVSSREIVSLRSTKPGDRVALARVPVSANSYGSVVLRRIDVYAPDAQIFVVGADGPREIPRSQDLHFVSVSGPRIALSIAADGRQANGVLFTDEGRNYQIAGNPQGNDLVLALAQSTDRTPDGRMLEYNTDGLQDSLEPPAGLKSVPTNADAQTKATDATTVASRQAVVSIDTDNEFMLNKFADNSTNATNYIASMFVQMNVIYERDLDVTLVQGTTFLRPSSTTDPYPSTSGTSTSAQLTEFSEYWRVNNGAVSTAFALLLSGKSSNPNGSSGIAWLVQAQNYCAAKGQVFGGQTFGHFALDRVFLFAGSTAATDMLVAAHEVGHNFGAAHTHCTDQSNGSNSVATNTIDTCYNGEAGAGCFAGAQSCPAPHTVNGVTNVTGTLMSYCHLSGIGGCGSALVFSDIQRTVLTSYIGAAYNFPACITPAGGGLNHAPTLNSISNPAAMLEDAAQQTVNLSGIGDGDGNTQTLTVTAASNNTGLIPNPTVTYTSPNATGSLAYTPVANQSGSATITVTVTDNGGTAGGGVNTFQRQFTVNVTAVNDAPTLNAIADPASIPEDSALQTVNLAGIGPGPSEVQVLTVTAQSNNTGLIPNPSVTYTSPNATGSITYTPVANQSGSAVVTVTVTDNGGTANGGVATFQRTFNVAVSAVNDAPTVAAPVAIAVAAPGTTMLAGISVADIDAGNASVTLTLNVSAGTLAGLSSGGVTASGTGTATLTLTGTMANINAYITANSVSFVTIAALPGSVATLTSTMNDGGNTGSGGAKTGNATTTLDAGLIFKDSFE